MILVRAATAGEIKDITSDALAPLCPNKWAFEKEGKLIAFAGVNVASLTSPDGWPWVRLLDKSCLSSREILKIATKSLALWSQEYQTLRACAEEGENEKWFRFLGFTVDMRMKPLYAGGKTLVYMRYIHGQ